MKSQAVIRYQAARVALALRDEPGFARDSMIAKACESHFVRAVYPQRVPIRRSGCAGRAAVAWQSAITQPA
jgi:hypothetical protein